MTPAGIALALMAILVSMVMDHGKPMSIISIPSMILVLGGTFGVSMAGLAGHDLKPIRGALKSAMRKSKSWTATDFAQHLMSVAREARSVGLLALAQGLPEAKTDPFVKSGVELITTTSDPDRVRGVLDAEIAGMRSRHRVGDQVLPGHGRLRADDRHPRHGHRTRPRARQPRSSRAHSARRSRARSPPRLWGVMTREHLLDPDLEQAAPAL